MQQTREQYSCVFLSRDPTQWMMPTARGVLPSFSRTWPLFGPDAFTMCSTWSAVNTFGYRPNPYCGTLCGVDRLEPGGHHDRPDLDLLVAVLLPVVDRLRLADGGADAAGIRLEVDAGVVVDDRLVRHGLHRRDVDGRHRAEGQLAADLLGLVVDRDAAGGADLGAGAAGDALVRGLVVWRADVARRAAVEEPEDVRPDHVRADPHAEAAEDAGVVAAAEARLGDPVLLRHRVQHRDVAAAGEQPFEDQRPRAAHPVGLGEHLDAVGDGVVAGRHQAHAAPHVHLDGADAADAVRLDQRVMAERRDLHPDLLRHLHERRAVFGLGLDAVNRDCHELHRGLQHSGTGR